MATLGKIAFINDNSFNVENVENKSWLLTTEGAIMLSRYYGVGNTTEPIYITFFPFVMSPTDDFQIHLKVMDDLCDVQHETNGEVQECHTLLGDGSNSAVVIFTKKDNESKTFTIDTTSEDPLVLTQDADIATLDGDTLTLVYREGIVYPQYITVSNYCGNIKITVSYGKGNEDSCFLSVSQNRFSFEYDAMTNTYEPSSSTFSVNSSSAFSLASLNGFEFQRNVSEYKIIPKHTDEEIASNGSVLLSNNCEENLSIYLTVNEKDISDTVNCNTASISLGGVSIIRYNAPNISSSLTVVSTTDEFDFSVDDRLIVTKTDIENELKVDVSDALLDYVERNEICTIYDAIVVFNECGKRASCTFEITSKYIPQITSGDSDTENECEFNLDTLDVSYGSDDVVTVTSTKNNEPINWWFENVSIFPTYDLIYEGELTSDRKLIFREPTESENNYIYVRCKQGAFEGKGCIKLSNECGSEIINITHTRPEEVIPCDFTTYEITDFEIG